MSAEAVQTAAPWLRHDLPKHGHFQALALLPGLLDLPDRAFRNVRLKLWLVLFREVSKFRKSEGMAARLSAYSLDLFFYASLPCKALD